VSPLDASGALKASYKITRHLGHGTCQTGSYQTGKAYRCSTPEAGAVVLDPCWLLTTPSSTMACQGKPWVHEVVQLHVSGTATGGPGLHSVSLPWGMRIGASVRCLRDVGAVRRLNGHLLLYHCTRHRDVFGPFDDSGAHWMAHVYRNNAHTRSGYASLGRQHVAIAWRGAAAGSTTPSSPSPSASAVPTATPSLSPLT
jgi:hypothetical protein